MGSNNLRPDRVEPEEEEEDLEVVVTESISDSDRDSSDDREDEDEDDDDEDDEKEDPSPRSIDLAPPPEKLNEIVLEKLNFYERKWSESERKNIKRQEDLFVQDYNDLRHELQRADQAYAEAVSNADGHAATQAMQYRDQIKQRIANMEYAWDNYQENGRVAAEQQEYENRQLEIVRNHSVRWQKEFGYHKYDQTARKVIYDLDDKYAKTVAQYPATDPRYWKGLTKYIKEHTEKVGNMSAQTTRAPQERPKKEIYISKDRRDAMIQAGVWDDPVLRMKYVKQYQQWDKENAADLRR